MSASEFRVPPKLPVPAGCLGAVGTVVGMLKSIAVVGPAGWRRAGLPQGTGSSAGAGKGEDRGSGWGGEAPGLRDSLLAFQPMWQHLRWLCSWPWCPDPTRLGGPCQWGHGAGDLVWLPHAGQPPQPRHLQKGSTQMS